MKGLRAGIFAGCAISLFQLGAHGTEPVRFDGADRFDGPAKNTELWGPDIIAGNAALSLLNGRLYHTVSSTDGISDDFGIWFWNGKAAATNDWLVQIDVHVPVPIVPLAIVNGKAQRYGLGMAVTKAGADPTAAFMTSAVFARYGTPTGSSHDFVSEFQNAATATYNVEIAPSGVPASSIRIRWEAASKTLFAEFDADGSVGGYSWTTLRTVPNNDWNLSDADSFSIFINGSSAGLALNENHELYADNFLASTGALPPITVGLRFATELFWNSPVNRMQQLQSSENAEDWINVGLPSIGTGDATNTFDSSPMAAKRFYRVIAQ